MADFLGQYKNNYEEVVKFEETQTINLNEIICDICKNNNRGNTHENKFYICNNCNKNLCILCKQNHDKNHNVLNYDN